MIDKDFTAKLSDFLKLARLDFITENNRAVEIGMLDDLKRDYILGVLDANIEYLLKKAIQYEKTA